MKAYDKELNSGSGSCNLRCQDFHYKKWSVAAGLLVRGLRTGSRPNAIPTLTLDVPPYFSTFGSLVLRTAPLGSMVL